MIPTPVDVSHVFTDHVYKITPSGALHLRLWPTTSSHTPLAPLAFYIHGGAWTHGDHTLPPPWILKAFTDAGFHFISTSYRFAPPVSLREQMEDCLDAWRWCRDELPGLLEDELSVDPLRWVAMGQSAGANLSMMMGHFAPPDEKPSVIFDGFGQVSFLDPQSYPEEPYLSTPRSDLSAQEVARRAHSRDKSSACSWCPWTIFEQGAEDLTRIRGLSPGTYDIKEAQRHFDTYEHIFYAKNLYETVMHKEECRTEKEWRQRLVDYSVSSQVDSTFPPTVILHGEEDEVVNVERTREFASRLRSKGVTVEEHYVPGAKHSCDEGWGVSLSLANVCLL